MGGLLGRIATAIASNDLIWFFFHPFIRFSDLLKRSREKNTHEKYSLVLLQKVFSNTITVRNGYFKGMNYPRFQSYGSAIFPKLLGSYEKELTEVIKKILSKEYQNIIDVGCAEGYYAVGFAMNTKAKIYAYDINDDARTFCLEMAKLNKVDELITLKSLCDENVLRTFDFEDQNLIISDCEGFEQKLFTTNNIANLKKCDLLIEIHDNVDITISQYIMSLFQSSHNIQIIRSLDDLEKIKSYEYKELEGLNFNEKKHILSEGRPNIMEWYWITSKT